MPVLRRGQRWVWAGQIVAALILVGLVTYMIVAGLTTANLVGGALGGLAALAALLAPYLLPPSSSSPRGPTASGSDQVENSGAATATAGGEAITGVQDIGGVRAIQVHRSGDARADGPGSVAITGFSVGPTRAHDR
jgi:hypothetical protein